MGLLVKSGGVWIFVGFQVQYTFSVEKMLPRSATQIWNCHDFIGASSYVNAQYPAAEQLSITTLALNILLSRSPAESAPLQTARIKWRQSELLTFPFLCLGKPILGQILWQSLIFSDIRFVSRDHSCKVMSTLSRCFSRQSAGVAPF